MNIFQKVTLKNLRHNPTRTLVTIVGILLSAAMFTAVTTCASSLLQYLIRNTCYNVGSWYGAIMELSMEEAEKIQKDEQVVSSVYMNRLGFAPLENSRHARYQYLCVNDISENFTDLLPVHLVTGRMPQNSSELLLPVHVKTDGGFNFKLGDELTLKLGSRLDQDGNKLNNRDAYRDGSDAETGKESWVYEKTVAYTVVGFYEHPSYEDLNAPGFTALTCSGKTSKGSYDVYLKTANGAEFTSAFLKLTDSIDHCLTTSNHDLLRLYGLSGESTYNATLKGLASILIGIIMFGSISLIYNAFSISVSERTKQFGLLSSIGATRRQLTGSVLFEAFYLSCIGIPLGVFSGLIGIGITLHFTGSAITSFLSGSTAVPLTLYASLPSLAAAVAVSCITILISAYLPARRAMRKSAMDAIRLTDDIAIRPSQVKTSALTRKLFGFVGMLAEKNFKRNRKKYRATVISLFISIVLFISSSSFGAYLTTSADRVMSAPPVDVTYIVDPETAKIKDMIKLFTSIEGVTEAGYFMDLYLSIHPDYEAFTPEFKNRAEALSSQGYLTYNSESDIILSCIVTFLEDDVFREYLSANGLDDSEFFNSEDPQAVAVNSFQYYNREDERYYNIPALKEDKAPKLSLPLDYVVTDPDRTNSGHGEETIDTEDSGVELRSIEFPVHAAALVSETPPCLQQYSSSIMLVYPYSMVDRLFSGLDSTKNFPLISQPLSKYRPTTASFRCENTSAAVEEMKQILIENNLPMDPLYDFTTSYEHERAMVFVIHVFSYGFITLISLIAAANVFNTISTNIQLRRREFAMLKSIGLTPGDFRTMMYFECLLYGLKGLFYGLPASIGVTWLIYRTILSGLELNFFIPWSSFVIAIGSVFLVVFSTMFYTTWKMKEENTIETLKNENL